MIRNAFNGGELSPQVQMRGDLDIFARGCSVVENFDIGQAGGVSRRRGFRYFGRALSEWSRLFVYDAGGDTRYLVELDMDRLRVWNVSSESVEWETGLQMPYYAVEKMRTLQVNSILLFLSNYSATMQLRRDGDGVWSWEEYCFKVPPWRYSEYRENAVKVTRRNDGNYEVMFAPGEDETEGSAGDGDVIRVSHYTDAKEIKGRAQLLFNAVTRREDEGFIKKDTNVGAGTVFAVRREVEATVYSCVGDFTGSDDFVDGLVDPANYADNFQIATDTAKYDVSVSELSKSTSVKRGQRLRFETGYWDIFTCVAEFVGANDFRSGGINPEDYPGHFVRGYMIGSAPCKGAWKFYCSGTWYGSYEVRACYEGDGLVSDDWEYRAEAWSQNAAPSSVPVGGDESGEECYISLWITRVRAYGSIWALKCFPSDVCGNALIVNSYKHDMMLREQSVVDEENQQVLDTYYVRIERIKVQWYGTIQSLDWSWSAFSWRYGYPRLACIFNQRLVFGGTEAQPMTVWMSQTDDIDNFDIIDQDNGAMALTISGETQDPIRWMESQNSRIMLGTSRGEYVMQSANGGIMTCANASVIRHGFGGAADVNHIQCEDKVIYIGRGSVRAKQYGYDYAQDAYLSTDLNVFAEHVLEDGGGVKEGCVLTKPNAKAVFVLNKGQLALMTYNSMHQVHAWHRYVTDGVFLSVASMPNGDAADKLYAVVKRTEVVQVPDGLADPEDTVDVCYLEVMDDKSCFTDGLSGLNYTSTLLTNALVSTQKGSPKKVPDSVMLYLPDEAEASGVEVTVDGGVTWAKTGISPSLTIPKGWNEFDGFTTPSYDVEVGFRVTGNHGFDVLALQG